MQQEAESPPIFSWEFRDYVYTFMSPVEYTLTENISKTDPHSSTSGEEELDDSEDEYECANESFIWLQRNLIVFYNSLKFIDESHFFRMPPSLVKNKRSLSEW